MMSNMRTEFEVTIRCTFLLALFFSEIPHSSALLIMRSCSGLAYIAASSSSADTLHASIGIPVNGHGISLIKVTKSPVMSRFRLLGSQRYFERNQISEFPAIIARASLYYCTNFSICCCSRSESTLAARSFPGDSKANPHESRQDH